jgi:LPS sulfotransferase NodH
MDQKSIKTAREYLAATHPDFPIPGNCYLVLSSARSGSTLLCRHLTEIGYGRPIEAFNPNLNPRKRLNWGIDYNDPKAYIQKAIEYQTVNGVTGMKLSPNQFRVFLENAHRLLAPAGVQLKDAEIVEVFFPKAKLIHLQRRKKLKQAVSYAKALQNGIWRETTDQDEEYKQYLLPALYDRDHIECCFDIAVSNDVYWQHYLRTNELKAFLIYYEDLAADYVKNMTEIYRFLGIKGKEVIAPPLRKQSNKESQDWEAMFIQDTPWFSDPAIKAAYDAGDLDTLFLLRSRMIILAREQARWKVMPANRTKSMRNLLFRVKRKLSPKKA